MEAHNVGKLLLVLRLLIVIFHILEAFQMPKRKFSLMVLVEETFMVYFQIYGHSAHSLAFRVPWAVFGLNFPYDVQELSSRNGLKGYIIGILYALLDNIVGILHAKHMR